MKAEDGERRLHTLPFHHHPSSAPCAIQVSRLFPLKSLKYEWMIWVNVCERCSFGTGFLKKRES